MKRYLYENFLTDPDEYLLLEKEWKSVVINIVSKLADPASWKLSFGLQLNDGTELKDGNPVVSGQNDQNKRYFRIVQFIPKADQAEFLAWLKYKNTEDYIELTIACPFSEHNVKNSSLLLGKLILEQFSVEELLELVNSIVETNT